MSIPREKRLPDGEWVIVDQGEDGSIGIYVGRGLSGTGFSRVSRQQAKAIAALIGQVTGGDGG